jgi:hypothetical protein
MAALRVAERRATFAAMSATRAPGVLVSSARCWRASRARDWRDPSVDEIYEGAFDLPGDGQTKTKQRRFKVKYF